MKNYFKNKKPEAIHSQLLSLKTLMTFFRTKCDIWSYLIYGTLLGSIREKDVIANDTDYDIALLIPGDTIDEVKENFYKLGAILIEHKMLGKIWTDKGAVLKPTNVKQIKNPMGQMHIMTPDGKCYIDVWLSWFNNGKYYLTKGVKGELKRNVITPFQWGYIQDVPFIIPNNSECILEQVYGGDWMIPQIKKSNGQKFTMRNVT